MDKSMSPEDEKFLKSLFDLVKIGDDTEKQMEEEKSATPDEENDSEEDNEEKPIRIPSEQLIEPAERVEMFKSSIPPEYVKKVVRELDGMSTQMLKQALKRIHVPDSGSKKTLRKRVAQYYRKENMLLNRKMETNSDKTSRFFDYLIAVDLECTCIEVIYDYPHEIIELPAVLIDVREMKIISEFRTYVRPVKNPILSTFCMEFTKISQETVDNAPYFREALLRMYTWMRKFGLGDKNTRFAFVTDGPHDFWKFMQFQCVLSNIRMPHMFRSFINIKKTFKEKFNGLVKGNGKSGIENMLEKLGLTFRGNKHSGLDDARNIAAIAIEMMKLKIELRINQKCTYKESSVSQKEQDEELEDAPDLRSQDVSRRDFQMWMRKLPMKLMSVTRREFLQEEYLDCDSCDDLADEKVWKHRVLKLQETEESKALKMEIRAELENSQNEEFEKCCQEKGRFKIGEIKQMPTTKKEAADDFEESDDDVDYNEDAAVLTTDKTGNTSFIELDTVWEDPVGVLQLPSPDAAGSSTLSSTSTNSTDCGPSTPFDIPTTPRNSLASGNRRYPN